MKRNIKIRSTSFLVEPANIKKNTETIKKLIDHAETDGVNILSLPELSLTGASLYDGYLEKDIQDKALEGLFALKDFSATRDLIFSLGLPVKTQDGLYNSIFLIKGGEILAFYTKENLKAYEKTVFNSGGAPYIEFPDDPISDSEVYPIDISGLKIGVSIGEDEEAIIPKSLKLRENGTDIILNPAAFERHIFSKEKIRDNIRFLSKDLIYVHTPAGLGESTTDLVYTKDCLIANDGKIIDSKDGVFAMDIRDTSYETDFKKFTKDRPKAEKFPYLPKSDYSDSYMNEALDIQARGLLTRMKKIGVSKTFIGVSGGIDSTAALLAIDRAYDLGGFDKKDIGAYTLPAFGTSDRTKSNAYKLCEAMGIDLKEIDISKSVSAHLSDIGHDGKTQDTAYENAQARMRTQVLFNLSNMYGGLVIGTGDLSENMQGFATYNGDHMSSYSLNASLMKTELRYIIRSYAHFTGNDDLRKVLLDILDTPISPELTHEDDGEISQKTEDIIGPYELIDFFIYDHLEDHKKAIDILDEAEIAFEGAYDRATIKKWLISYFKRFASSQFKRSASVDGPNVTGRSFSPRLGFVVPSDMDPAVYLRDLEDEDK